MPLLKCKPIALIFIWLAEDERLRAPGYDHGVFQMLISICLLAAWLLLPSAALAQARVMHFPETESLGRLHVIADPCPIRPNFARGEVIGQARGTVRLPAATKTLPPEIVTLHFPEPLGTLYCVPPGGSNDLEELTKIGEARGDVRVPKGAKLILEVGYAAGENPNWLNAHGPNFFSALDFSKVDTTDNTIAKIVGLTGLQALNLNESDVTNAVVPSLRKLKNLQDLKLRHAQITDACVPQLVKIESLKSLMLSEIRLSDGILKYFERCQQLRCLDLSSCSISDVGLRSLQNVRGLVVLILDGNKKVTAKGLMQLQNLKHLQQLSVRDTGVTAQDLPTVQALRAKLPALDTILLSDQSFSREAVSKWKAALPGLKLSLRVNDQLKNDSRQLFAPLHSWSERGE